MARSWKSARRQGNYWTSNLLLFEWNWTKDYEDTVKIPTVGNQLRDWDLQIKINCSCTENNTNIVSDSQDKLMMLRSWKSVWRWGNYRTLNPLLFERSLTKTMKIIKIGYLPLLRKLLRWSIWEQSGYSYGSGHLFFQTIRPAQLTWSYFYIIRL